MRRMPFVGVLGLEPRMTGPESVVLPLHHTPNIEGKTMTAKPLALPRATSELRVQRYCFFLNYKHFCLLFSKKSQINAHF